MLPALSFLVILVFGKKLPKRGAESGILAVGASFVLAVLVPADPHESPRSMTVPLVLLAIPSVAIRSTFPLSVSPPRRGQALLLPAAHKGVLQDYGNREESPRWCGQMAGAVGRKRPWSSPRRHRFPAPVPAGAPSSGVAGRLATRQPHP